MDSDESEQGGMSGFADRKKLFLLISTIVVIGAIVSLILILPEKAQEGVKKIRSGQELYMNSISYLECSEDKGMIKGICKRYVKELSNASEGYDECIAGIATVYTGYLHKTQQAKNYELIGKIIHRTEQGISRQFSEQEVITAVHKFLAGDEARPEFPSDLRVWKSEDEEEMIRAYKNNTGLSKYLRNILEYKKAARVEDCEKIQLPPLEEESNRRNFLVKDACVLTFVQDKSFYCENFEEIR